MRRSLLLAWALSFIVTGCGLSPGLDLPSARGGESEGDDFTDDGGDITISGPLNGGCASAGAGGMGGACSHSEMGGSPP